MSFNLWTIKSTKGRLTTLIRQHSMKVTVATSTGSQLAKFDNLLIKPANYSVENNDQFFNSGLPSLEYQGFRFSDINAIVRYLTRRADRPDMLGLTPQNQVIFY